MIARFPHHALVPVVRGQVNMLFVDDNLARMFEIHGDLSADVGLHLPQPPIGPRWMSHHHARFQHRPHFVPFERI